MIGEEYLTKYLDNFDEEGKFRDLRYAINKLPELSERLDAINKDRDDCIHEIRTALDFIQKKLEAVST